MRYASNEMMNRYIRPEMNPNVNQQHGNYQPRNISNGNNLDAAPIQRMHSGAHVRLAQINPGQMYPVVTPRPFRRDVNEYRVRYQPPIRMNPRYPNATRASYNCREPNAQPYLQTSSQQFDMPPARVPQDTPEEVEYLPEAQSYYLPDNAMGIPQESFDFPPFDVEPDIFPVNRQSSPVNRNESHNQVEKRRRDKIREGVTRIQECLPETNAKESTSEILTRACNRLRFLNITLTMQKYLRGKPLSVFEQKNLNECSNLEYENSLKMNFELFNEIQPSIFYYSYQDMMDRRYRKRRSQEDVNLQQDDDQQFRYSPNKFQRRH
ncbi:hypothetical protein ACOME3_004292 [Neoechinorhynchus agilis]